LRHDELFFRGVAMICVEIFDRLGAIILGSREFEFQRSFVE